MAAAREQLGSAQAAAAAAKAAVGEKMVAQASAVAAFEQSFLDRTKTEQAALLEQIAGMLTRCVDCGVGAEKGEHVGELVGPGS